MDYFLNLFPSNKKKELKEDRIPLIVDTDNTTLQDNDFFFEEEKNKDEVEVEKDTVDIKFDYIANKKDEGKILFIIERNKRIFLAFLKVDPKHTFFQKTILKTESYLYNRTFDNYIHVEIVVAGMFLIKKMEVQDLLIIHRL